MDMNSLLIILTATTTAALSVALLCVVRDVRSRSAKEEMLRERAEVQKRIVESIPYPLFMKDSVGRYMNVNRPYELMFGLSAVELLGKTNSETDHIRSPDFDRLRAMEKRVLVTGGQLSQEVEIEREGAINDHHLVWISRVDYGNQDFGVLGAVVDVSSIRRAEACARSYEKRLLDVTSALPAAVFQMRMDLRGDCEFTYAGGDTLGTIGLTVDEVKQDRGMALRQIHEEDRRMVMQHVSDSVREMEPIRRLDFRVVTEEGIRWIRTSGGAPMQGASGAIEWSGYWIDVTEEHETTTALMLAKIEAEAGTEAKSMFLATMSHEIRTPMAGIIGLVELVADTSLNGEQRNMLRMIESSAKALMEILDEILDYSRIEAGKLKLIRAPFDVREMVDSVVGLFSARAWEKGLRISGVVDWRIAPELDGDINRIRQVLLNLASNAIKFTSFGEVAIRIELVEDHGASQRIRLCVTDTGEGIPADRLETLFEPFMQVPGGESEKTAGTGLGLTVCHRLVELMGGTINFSSTVGLGTVATVELELGTLRSLMGNEHYSHEFTGYKALLCLRDQRLGQMISNALSAMGFLVLEADPADVTGMDWDLQSVLVYEDGIVDAVASSSAVRRVRIVDRPEMRAVCFEGGEVVLYSNPLLWRSLRDACHLAFGKRSEAPPANRQGADVNPGVRVLVAEDNTIKRQVLSMQLDRLGIEHEVAEDGVAALRALQRGRFDLLLTDCQMPNCDGFELVRRIRESERNTGAHMPVLALTASAMPEELRRCVDAGMDEALAKPIQLQGLREALERHLPRTLPPAPDSVAKTGAQVHGGNEVDEQIRLLCEAFGGRERVAELIDGIIIQVLDVTARIKRNEAQGDYEAAKELRHMISGTVSLIPLGTSEHMSTDALDAWVTRASLLRSRL